MRISVGILQKVRYKLLKISLLSMALLKEHFVDNFSESLKETTYHNYQWLYRRNDTNRIASGMLTMESLMVYSDNIIDRITISVFNGENTANRVTDEK